MNFDLLKRFYESGSPNDFDALTSSIWFLLEDRSRQDALQGRVNRRPIVEEIAARTLRILGEASQASDQRWLPAKWSNLRSAGRSWGAEQYPEPAGDGAGGSSMPNHPVFLADRSDRDAMVRRGVRRGGSNGASPGDFGGTAG